jgi:WD40 repeat protein
MSFAYSPDGTLLAANVGSTGDASAGITLWDPGTGQQRGSPIEGISHQFTVRFSPDGRYVLAEDGDHAIGVWDVQTRQHVHSFGVPEQGDLWCLQFSPDGERLLSSSNDWKVKVWPWNADDLPLVHTPLLELPMVRVDGQWNRAAFSHDGQRLITGGEGHTVKVGDATTGQLLRTLTGHKGDAYAVVASPDVRWLASAGEDTTIRLWDAETGEAKYKLHGHMGVINTLAFSHDSRLLASGCRDNTVKVWRLDRIAAK